MVFNLTLEHALEQTQTHNNHWTVRRCLTFLSKNPIEGRKSCTKVVFKENVGKRQYQMPCQADNVADNDWETRFRLLNSWAMNFQWKSRSYIKHPAPQQRVQSGMTSLNGQNDNMMTIQHRVWIERVSHAHKHTHTLNEWKMISSNQDLITITLNTVDSLTNRLNRFSLQHHSIHLHRHRDTVVAFYPLLHSTRWHMAQHARWKHRSNQEFSGTQHKHKHARAEREWEGGRGVGVAFFPYFLSTAHTKIEIENQRMDITGFGNGNICIYQPLLT